MKHLLSWVTIPLAEVTLEFITKIFVHNTFSE